jgi:ATP/maltotriose-dependent transcriptional regulator MalT
MMRAFDPLVSTKLRPSQVRPKLVARPRLTARLERETGRRLTLISAPAGSGKTTLLAGWLEDCAAGGRLVAWVSLDEGDNDPARFLSYLVAALRTVREEVGEGVLAALRSPQPPRTDALTGALINELASLSEEVDLVLDDYHLIASEAVHGVVSYMLEHLPPNVHLVIASRTDPPLPLARLRARGQIDELGAAELAFTSQEAAAFLSDVMGLETSAEDAAALEGRTEGWVAGMQLAALSMRDRRDVSGYVRAFSGSNRDVLDYLAEEVLERQPERIRKFLLETSVLDHLSASLCDALTGRSDGQEMLERLENKNLFVVALDDERRWYRYHHLFAGFLRSRLEREGSERIAELHRRAGVWFEWQGLMSEAVRHALVAGCWEHAANLIEDQGLPVVLGGQVRTVLGWIDALPDALVRGRSVLCVVHATALIFANQLHAAEARLRHAEGLVGHNTSDDLSRLVLGQVAQLRAITSRFSGDLVRCVELARRALGLLPETEMLFRSGARLNVARAYQLSGDVGPDNERLASEVVLETRASGSLFAIVNSLTNLAQLQRIQGRLRAAADTYRQTVRAVPGQQGLESLVGGAAYFVGLGDINREWNDLEAAERLLLQGMDLVRGLL